MVVVTRSQVRVDDQEYSNHPSDSFTTRAVTVKLEKEEGDNFIQNLNCTWHNTESNRMRDQQQPVEQEVQPDVQQQEILIRVLSKDSSKRFVQSIRVHPGLSIEEFERCIALNAYGNDDCINRHVYALFREFDGTSISLSEILSAPNQFQGEIMTVLHPSQVEAFSSNVTKAKLSHQETLLPRLYYIIRDIILLSLFSLVVFKAWESHDYLENFNERALVSALSSPINIIDYAVEHPLRWLYRNGPSIVGWDGMNYPDICAAMVPDVAGIDEAFWFNNIDRCKALYNSRERAMINKMKPLCYLFYAYVVYKLIMHWIYVKAKSQPDPR